MSHAALARSPYQEETLVEVVQDGGEWAVRIVENGEETALLTFESETFAASYALGQRLRLGLTPATDGRAEGEE